MKVQTYIIRPKTILNREDSAVGNNTLAILVPSNVVVVERERFLMVSTCQDQVCVVEREEVASDFDKCRSCCDLMRVFSSMDDNNDGENQLENKSHRS